MVIEFKKSQIQSQEYQEIFQVLMRLLAEEHCQSFLKKEILSLLNQIIINDSSIIEHISVHQRQENFNQLLFNLNFQLFDLINSLMPQADYTKECLLILGNIISKQNNEIPYQTLICSLQIISSLFSLSASGDLLEICFWYLRVLFTNGKMKDSQIFNMIMKIDFGKVYQHYESRLNVNKVDLGKNIGGNSVIPNQNHRNFVNFLWCYCFFCYFKFDRIHFSDQRIVRSLLLKIKHRLIDQQIILIFMQILNSSREIFQLFLSMIHNERELVEMLMFVFDLQVNEIIREIIVVLHNYFSLNKKTNSANFASLLDNIFTKQYFGHSSIIKEIAFFKQELQNYSFDETLQQNLN